MKEVVTPASTAPVNCMNTLSGVRKQERPLMMASVKVIVISAAGSFPAEALFIQAVMTILNRFHSNQIERRDSLCQV